MDAPNATGRTSAFACSLCLLLAGAILAWPFFSSHQLGAGDSLWYVNMMADAVAQTHAGVFPLFVGQSEFAFNGSTYPLRNAPYFQYFGVIVDALTFRSLSAIQLQHAVASLSILGGLISTYLCLHQLRPGDRWSALLLAILYSSCPGISALVFAQDLYMSAMAQPWVPLAFYGAAKLWLNPSPSGYVASATGLAALWWAHAPIALWSTVIVAGLFVARWRQLSWRLVALAAVVFALLSLYPFVSTLSAHDPGENIVPFAMNRDRVVAALRDTFPANLCPVGRGPASLAEIQLGYSLWVLLAVGVTFVAIRRKAAPAVLLAAALAVASLLFPWPISNAFWRNLPEVIMGITFYWPMQRLYLLLAALVVLGFQLARPPATSRPHRFLLLGGLALAAAWSLSETWRMGLRYSRSPQTFVDSADQFRSENVAIMRQPYAFFSHLPAYFTHGVMDPWMESRLFDSAGKTVVWDNHQYRSSGGIEGNFNGETDANPGILNLLPSFALPPHSRYLVSFAFEHPALAGTLQMIGNGFFRQYPLPTAEGATGFGSGSGGTRPSLTLWNSSSTSVEVKMRFIPSVPMKSVTDLIPFAHYRVERLDNIVLPLQTEQLVPYYRAQAKTDHPGWVETPRVWIPGYRAVVDGQRVEPRKSAEHLVMIPVESGTHLLELHYDGPLLLRLAFWICASSWVLLAGLTLSGGYRRWSLTG